MTARPARARRALLFVPGTRPDRFEKALASGADAVCVDLEDAVAPERKAEARANALAFLAAASGGATGGETGVELTLRINAIGSASGRSDLDELTAGGGRPDAVMVPKVDGPESVQRLADRLASWMPDRAPAVLPLVESAAGLHQVEEIASASPHVGGLVFGGVDLAAELRCSTGWEALLYARSRVVHAAALAGVPAIDMPFLDVHDVDALAREARAARELGFAGKLVIHPAQVSTVQDAFTPTVDEVDRARRVVEAAEQARGRGAFLLDGRMVDEPVLRAARDTLARAGDRAGNREAASP